MLCIWLYYRTCETGIYDDADLGSVGNRVDAFSADLEADRSFEAAVGEVKVSEFFLHLIAVNSESEADVLELVAAHQLADFCKRRASVDMSLYRLSGLLGRVVLISLGNDCCQ